MSIKKTITRIIGVQIKNRENVTYRLVGADGKTKKMFAMNFVGSALLRLFRAIVKRPIGTNGMVKPGIMNYLAAYGLRVPFVCGNWTAEMSIANLITNAGIAGIASRIGGAGAEGIFDVIALGTGTGAAAATDTTLGTEITDSGLAKHTGTVSRVTTTITNDTHQVAYTFTATGSKAVTESGLLNSTPILCARQVFAAVNLVNGDQFSMTWKVASAYSA